MNKAKLTVLALSMSSISVGVYAQSSTSPLTLQDIQKQHTAQSQRLDNYGLLISNNLGLVNKANQDIQQVKSQQDQTQHSLSQLGKNILSSAVYQHDLDAKQDSKIASNQKNVQQLQAQVGADVARLTTHEQLIKANQQVSVTNQQAILANQKQNTQQAKGIISNQQGIQQLQTQAGTDVARLTTHEQLIKANQQVSVKNQQAILANQKQNTQQAKGITSNQQGVQQLQSQQAKLEQTSITNNSLIVSNQQDVTQLQQQQKNILDTAKINTQRMTENKSMIKKGQARITHNEESVNALGERVDKSTQLVTNNHEAIHKIQGNEQHNSQLIVSNTQGVKANTQHVSENKEAIHLQQSIALKDEQLMSANSHAIKQEQRDITTNSDAIARNQTEIKGLRKDMENMAKNIDGAYAESAAFAGLVDPYGVGNIAVTAALGYHGDAEAVAVGIGERFNENLTAKLGGAYDTATDSMSAYAGIGYEF